MSQDPKLVAFLAKRKKERERKKKKEREMQNLQNALFDVREGKNDKKSKTPKILRGKKIHPTPVKGEKSSDDDDDQVFIDDDGEESEESEEEEVEESQPDPEEERKKLIAENEKKKEMIRKKKEEKRKKRLEKKKKKQKSVEDANARIKGVNERLATLREDEEPPIPKEIMEKASIVTCITSSSLFGYNLAMSTGLLVYTIVSMIFFEWKEVLGVGIAVIAILTILQGGISILVGYFLSFVSFFQVGSSVLGFLKIGKKLFLTLLCIYGVLSTYGLGLIVYFAYGIIYGALELTKLRAVCDTMFTGCSETSESGKSDVFLMLMVVFGGIGMVLTIVFKIIDIFLIYRFFFVFIYRKKKEQYKRFFKRINELTKDLFD